ncbi:MAG: FtsW/RodA/SpoVE family cell cycle protein [Lachnospiraceae bacterium]|nr:FtsW/RodA/SpoVE family cell cycle protein [Lachnospiraceae bacterium]
MGRIIIEISKHVILICMCIYTIQCFAVFRYSNEYDRKGIYIRQNFFMVMVHFLGFISLYAQNQDLKYFKAYLIQQIGILVILIAYRLIYPRANALIINNMCMLITIGLLILTRISYNRAMRQFYIVMGSAAVTVIVPFIISRIRFFEKFKWFYVLAGILSLAAVLAFSTVINGSRLNITINNHTFQPSEFVKIIFVFAIASILARKHDIKTVIISAAVACIHVLILVASRDLGSAVIFFVVYFAMLYVATSNLLYYISGFLFCFIGCVAGYRLFSHVRVRVTAFLDPLGNITDAGYQIAQSLFAIGTGGWLGMGIGQGAPGNIPVVAADFIFAPICEEFGVIFGMCLILLCFSCFVMFMNIAMKFEDPFYKLVAEGLSVSYIFQVFLTIGGVVKFIPLTGVTLPFVSYGGTSVAVTCLVFAIIQGLYIEKGMDNRKGRTPKAADFKTERLDIVNID